nr:putative disease resistance rpp13-like protein 1 [Quercus suber]
MAEGLLQETEGIKQMEDLGSEYFLDLLGRSFFQQSSNHASRFVMHDLVNDLAQWAAGDMCYRLPKKIGNLVNLRHLDTTDAYLIKEMPVGLNNLKSRQTLPEFVVGKDTGSKVGDLMNLKFLRNTLCISGLENVLNVEDARKAYLNGKNLDVLVMKWGSSVLNDLLDARVAIDVLDMLQPPTTVKELSIKGYVGARFPTWLGDPLFSKLVLLKMNSCEKCTSLPAIGQLPSLEDLVTIGMAGVRSVGSEFYGDGFFNPFRSLVRLRFEDMQEWQDWIPCGVKYEEFPCLHELSIIKCPKLQGKLPHHLLSLEKISIRKCEQLFVSIPNFPMLHEVEIVGCKEVISKSPVELSSLKSMVLSISDLTSLTEEFMQGSTKVEYVTIDDCKELTSLWQERLISLVTLDIRSCPGLVNINLPYTLRTMKIKNCNALKSLPMSNSMCIEYAYIDNCHSLTCISRGQLPPTLRRLHIKNCENLQVVLDEEEASSSSSLVRNEGNLYGNSSSNESLLEHLEIRECSSLKCLSSKNQFPAALKNLFVYKCPELESVTKELQNNVPLEHFQVCHCEKLESLPEGLHRLCHLYAIKIWDCSSLVSLPDGGLLPTSLRKLSIENCEKLEALPNCSPNLTNLQELVICRCPSIISFTEEGYPTNLTSLWLSGVNILLLSKGFQHLSALEMLYIKDCPKLEYLPENGLPPSLLKLYIYRCPLLEQHCKKGKGREWFKIANIPRVEIDWRSVYEVEEEQE